MQQLTRSSYKSKQSKGSLFNAIPPATSRAAPWTPDERAQLMCSSTFTPPESYDERIRSMGSRDVFDQGDCGACWAFASSNTLAARYSWFMNQSMEKLSAEYMLACAATYGGKDGRNLQGCSGGSVEQAWYFLQNYGTVKNSCVHYTLKGESGNDEVKALANVCNISVCPDSGEPSYIYRASVSYLVPGVPSQCPQGSETNIRADLYSNGPVTVTMRMYADFLDYWLNLTAPGPPQTQVYAYDGTSDLQGYHAVMLAGWGSTPQTATRPAEKFWVVGNSWGRQTVDPDDWGSNGYFCIRRGTNECGIEETAVAGLPLVQPERMSPFYTQPFLQPLQAVKCPLRPKSKCRATAVVLPLTAQVMARMQMNPLIHVKFPNRHPRALPPPTLVAKASEVLRVCPADQPKRCTVLDHGFTTGLCATTEVDCARSGRSGRRVVVAIASVALAILLVVIIFIMVRRHRR